MFDPLKDTIDMLKNFGVEMSEKVFIQLEVKKIRIITFQIFDWCGGKVIYTN